MSGHGEDIKQAVREAYGSIPQQSDSCCGPQTKCCCGSGSPTATARAIGYSDEDLAGVPPDANLGLGCGNPVALASLKQGETVLDLGSGAGFDCFLAARKVGPTGRVIGVDMTPEMVERARANAAKTGFANIEFRLGEIEHLPVADSSADVIISNCVINLSPDKPQVFREAFRVLRPGGRLMVSDIVLLTELPKPIRDSVRFYVGCLSGAMLKTDYLTAIRRAGFGDITVVGEERFPIELMANDPTAQALIRNSGLSADELRRLADGVLSIKVSARKPKC